MIWLFNIFWERFAESGLEELSGDRPRGYKSTVNYPSGIFWMQKFPSIFCVTMENGGFLIANRLRGSRTEAKLGRHSLSGSC